MRISLLCNDQNHPVNHHLEKWIKKNSLNHTIEIVRRKSDLSGGDLLFLVSCSEIVDRMDRAAYRATLVLHASDLPEGRGWSPHIWQVIDGAETITVSMLEAEDRVDTGRIWGKIKVLIPKHALWDEINVLIFDAELSLMDLAVMRFDCVQPFDQDKNITPTYYPRRTPHDSQIDPNQSIASQFNKIRVCDPIRFPAFFYLIGKKFKLTIEKIDE